MSYKNPLVNCSFCGESSDKVRKTMQNNSGSAYICSKCISVFFHRLKKWVDDERHRMVEDALTGNLCDCCPGEASFKRETEEKVSVPNPIP